ncbi:MAG: helix-turn-helix transcriptional regulator [Quadrisphaera sp.]
MTRRFSAAVGEPPGAHLARWRLALAADLLREGDAPLDAVARRVGYGSGAALSAAFTRERGTSPTAHRRGGAGIQWIRSRDRRGAGARGILLGVAGLIGAEGFGDDGVHVEHHRDGSVRARGPVLDGKPEGVLGVVPPGRHQAPLGPLHRRRAGGGVGHVRPAGPPLQDHPPLTTGVRA